MPHPLSAHLVRSVHGLDGPLVQAGVAIGCDRCWCGSGFGCGRVVGSGGGERTVDPVVATFVTLLLRLLDPVVVSVVL